MAGGKHHYLHHAMRALTMNHAAEAPVPGETSHDHIGHSLGRACGQAKKGTHNLWHGPLPQHQCKQESHVLGAALGALRAMPVRQKGSSRKPSVRRSWP